MRRRIKNPIDGSIMNNDGTTLTAGEGDIDILKKAECCSHFSYTKSESEMIVLDIQRHGYTMFDAKVASSLPFSEDGKLFCVGNLFEQAIET